MNGAVLLTPLKRPMKAALKKIPTKLQECNYVHGELRPQNIILVGERLCIIDFDWAGVAGEVRYPQELNMLCNWHPAVHPGGIIAPEHDEYQINCICKC